MRTNRTSCIISFTTLTTAGIVLFFIAQPVSAFLMPEGGEAIAESATLIRILCLAFGFIGLQQVLTGTLRGAGDTVAPMVLAIVSLWVLRFPLAYVLSKHTPLGADGIWWAVAISIVVLRHHHRHWFARGDWKRRRLLEEVEIEQQAERQMAMEENLPF